MSTGKSTKKTNGIDVGALRDFIGQVAADPAAGMATFGVVTSWRGGTRTEARPLPMVIGPVSLERHFVIAADEPAELLGTNSAPNPQELILAALNSCVGATYVANAAAMDIELRSLTVRTKGTLDLRGYLSLDSNVNPGYDRVEYEVEIESPASAEAIEKLHAHVKRTSPNYHNFARSVAIDAKVASARR